MYKFITMTLAVWDLNYDCVFFTNQSSSVYLYGAKSQQKSSQGSEQKNSQYYKSQSVEVIDLFIFCP